MLSYDVIMTSFLVILVIFGVYIINYFRHGHGHGHGHGGTKRKYGHGHGPELRARTGITGTDRKNGTEMFTGTAGHGIPFPSRKQISVAAYTVTCTRSSNLLI